MTEPKTPPAASAPGTPPPGLFRKSVQWVWRHRKLTAGLVLVAAFLLLNLLVYTHAPAMRGV